MVTLTTRILLLPALLLALLAHGVGAESPAPAGSKSATQSSANPELTLKADMSADEVRHLMGQPDEIKPMKTPAGKAEIWTYKRRVNERVEQIEVGSIPTIETFVGSDGKVHQRTVGETVQYGELHRYTEETIELLVYDGRYVTQKITRRELKSYK